EPAPPFGRWPKAPDRMQPHPMAEVKSEEVWGQGRSELPPCGGAEGAGSKSVLSPAERSRPARLDHNLWICIIEAPKVGRLGGTALAMTTASPRIASPEPTSVCAMFATLPAVDPNGFGTRRAVTPQYSAMRW